MKSAEDIVIDVLERPATAVCISGPMSGLTDFNYPAFFAYEETLTKQGYSVLNPARNQPFKEDMTHADWMRLALHQVLQADEVHLLPGWEKSVGATLERKVAETLGLKIRTVAR